MKKVAVIFADGFEEIEGVSIVDVLRRGGVEVDIVGLDKLPIAGAHGVKFVCDMTLYDLEEEDYDMLVLPGGQPGVSNIEGNLKMREIIKRFDKKGKFIERLWKEWKKKKSLDEWQKIFEEGISDDMFEPEETQEERNARFAKMTPKERIKAIISEAFDSANDGFLTEEEEKEYGYE